MKRLETVVAGIFVAVGMVSIAACDGGKKPEPAAKAAESKAAETKGAPQADAKQDIKKQYAAYTVAGYAARGAAFEAGDNEITIAYVPDNKDGAVRDIEISAAKLNDPAHLANEDAFKARYKRFFDKGAKLTVKDIGGKKVYLMDRDDDVTGKEVEARFLGKENFELVFRITEKAKGKAPDHAALQAEAIKFIEQAARK